MEGPAAAGCPGCFLPSGRDVGPVGTLGVGGASEHTPICPMPGTRHGAGGDTGVDGTLGGLSLPGRTVSLLEEGPHPRGFSGRRFCSSGTEQGKWAALDEAEGGGLAARPHGTGQRTVQDLARGEGLY